jgi:hypothetical protein
VAQSGETAQKALFRLAPFESKIRSHALSDWFPYRCDLALSALDGRVYD